MKFKQHEINNVFDLIRVYEHEGQGYFFSKDTMKFFKSRVLDFSHDDPSTNALYFITSEKKSFNDNRRVYIIRKAHVFTDELGEDHLYIDSIGDKFTYTTPCRAKSVLKEILKSEAQNENRANA